LCVFYIYDHPEVDVVLINVTPGTTSPACNMGVSMTALIAATTKVEDVDGKPSGVLATDLAATIAEVKDVDGGPLEVLVAGPVAITTKVENVEGGPLGGAGGRSGSGHH
jgi:hypothetical protein